MFIELMKEKERKIGEVRKEYEKKLDSLFESMQPEDIAVNIITEIMNEIGDTVYRVFNTSSCYAADDFEWLYQKQIGKHKWFIVVVSYIYERFEVTGLSNEQYQYIKDKLKGNDYIQCEW